MNRMLDGGNNLKKIRLNMKIFKRYRDVYDKKHNRTHYFYNDMFETNIERISKTTITNIISKYDLNSMKVLSDALIRKTKENIIFKDC